MEIIISGKDNQALNLDKYFKACYHYPNLVPQLDYSKNNYKRNLSFYFYKLIGNWQDLLHLPSLSCFPGLTPNRTILVILKVINIINKVWRALLLNYKIFI